MVNKACITACRKRIIQYRNERQELAACQRLQEGKEFKQVQDLLHQSKPAHLLQSLVY